VPDTHNAQVIAAPGGLANQTFNKNQGFDPIITYATNFWFANSGHIKQMHDDA
jgi:hypothetical protein